MHARDPADGRRTYRPGPQCPHAGCRGGVAGAAGELITDERFDHFNEAVRIW